MRGHTNWTRNKSTQCYCNARSHILHQIYALYCAGKTRTLARGPNATQPNPLTSRCHCVGT
eukprot:5563665-Lingulodinium_polyedra.AAC.1